MSRTDELIAEFFDTKEGQLVIQGHNINELAEEHGTPFFVYDTSVLQKKIACLRDAFGPEFLIYYSLKANPDENVVKFFSEKL